MWLKVCCIQNKDEAAIAFRQGATHLGLVGAMPTGIGPISDERIIEITKDFNDRLKTVLLTSEKTSSSIVQHAKKVGSNALQIVREISLQDLAAVKNELKDIQLIQVVHVQDTSAIKRAVSFSDIADAILLDSGNPGNQTLGGTGNVHNWDVSKEIVAAVSKPVFLAGGIGPENVAKAIEHVHPRGIDLCSALRTNNKLSEDRLSRLVSEMKPYQQ